MLHTEEEEKKILIEKLNVMLPFIEQVKNLDTNNVEPLYSLTEEFNTFREDIPGNTLEHDKALKEVQGKFKNEIYFTVLKNK